MAKRISWVFCGLMTASSLSFAAVPEPLQGIPSTVDPGITRQRLQGEIMPPLSSGDGTIKAPEEPDSKMPADAAKIRFKLTKIIFTGNTVYSTQELQTIVQPSLNKTISLADLQTLVDEVTKKYRGNGYIISRAILPAQTIEHGVVKVQVVEGFVSQVTVQGDPGMSRSLLEKFGDHIESSRPLQIKLLERDMLLMNDIPGLTVKSVITPSKTVPGGADVTLVTDRKRWSAYGSYDNYGTRYLGPQQVTVNGAYNSGFLPGDSNSFRVVTVPRTSQMQFYELLHTQIMGVNGSRIALGTNYSYTHPGFDLTDLDVYGNSLSVFLDYAYPIWRTRTANLFVHAAGNYQNVNSTILDTPFYDDRVRSLTVGSSIDGIDRWMGSNSAGIDIEHGFQIMGANMHFNQSRPKGVPDFTKAILSLARLQTLSTRFSLLGAITGQYSFNPLLATEQFAYGGSVFGRGYDPSEIIGDDGLAGKLELRMQTMPEFRYLQAVQFYAFYDAGEIWNRDGVNMPAKQSAMSTGLGARFGFLPQLSGNFYIAKPLTRPVATIKAMGQNGNQYRTFFQIVANI